MKTYLGQHHDTQPIADKSVQPAAFISRLKCVHELYIVEKMQINLEDCGQNGPLVHHLRDQICSNSLLYKVYCEDHLSL